MKRQEIIVDIKLETDLLLFAQNHFNTVRGYDYVDLLFLYVLQFEFIL